MTTATRTRRSPAQSAEQRRARQDELLTTLADGVQALTTSDGWRRYLQAMATLRTYSLSNQLLILSQRPDATTVAGYRTWQSMGRQVRRGAKGIGIFGYSTKTSVQQVTDENGTTDEKTLTRTFFPVRTVFDISDTDGEEIRVPTDVRNAGNSQAAMSAQVYEQISGWLTRQEWDVQRVEISGSARGYTNHTERLVRVAVGLDDINAARVLLHEAAHVTLHGPDSGFITTEQYAASRTHRGTAEIQADGAAYVLADLLGLDTEQASIGYVAGWAAAAAGTGTDADAITAAVRGTAAAILHAVNTIAEAIGLDH